MIKRGGKVEGFDAVFAGNVPLGAGLSSSAALESCFAFAINDLFNDNKFPKMELAKIGQSTEHNYCGVNCGIMDQFASVHGKKDHLMRLDCRSGEFEYFPSSSTATALCSSTPRQARARRLSLQQAPRELRACGPHPRRRDPPRRRHGYAQRCKDQISDEDYRRAKYVIEEKQRVLDVCEALLRHDYDKVGDRMYRTHAGLSKDYEVSCEELDFLNDIARECGVTGSRIMAAVSAAAP